LNYKNIALIGACSSLSGLLFGYDAGIIASALLFIKTDFSIESSQIGLMVAMVPLGALISSIFSGFFVDILGRKRALVITALLFIVGSVFCSSAIYLSHLILGRLILGLAIGIGSCVSPVYTAELAEERHRGWLVNLYVLSVQIGIFFSFLVGYLLSGARNWRLMIFIGVFPAIILIVGVLFLPESPRWLILQNKHSLAQKIMERLYGREESVKMLEDILVVMKNSGENGSSKKSALRILLSEPRLLKILFIGVSVSVFTQTVGINIFNYYGPTIFEATGFSDPSKAIFYTMLFGATLVVSTFTSLFFIDRIGRRRPLILGTMSISLILLITAMGFYFIPEGKLLALLFLSCSMLFMIFHGVSIGPACFLIPSEIFPNRIRALCMGVSVATNWLANFIISTYTPRVIDTFGIYFLFFIFLFLTICGLFIFYFFVPETKGISLERIEKNVIRGVKCRDLGSNL
jgi:sugar porter (SP) family MFS transporter